MKTVALTAFVLVVLLVGGVPRSQELSTDIFPSEDEIYDALRSGEITYQQYLILQDISSNGIDSTNWHLLDEIPNLSFFSVDSTSLETSLENEQEVSFKIEQEPGPSQTQVSGLFRQRYSRYAQDEDRSKSSTLGRLNISNFVLAELEIRREYTGHDRFVSRSLTYRGRKGPVREVVVGNFSRRFGLGTVFGYRGKLFGLSRDLDGDSFLYPDYGGHNGVVTRLSFGQYEVHVLGSLVRSPYTRLSVLGGMIRAKNIPFKPALIIGVTRLKNRRTGQYIAGNKFGLNGRYDYRRGYAALEACWQRGTSNSFGAVVTEGRHRFRQAEIKYAGWSYSDDYIDLTGGSKAASMYHDQIFETVNRDYSSKRVGQRGTLVKTIVDLSEKLELANSLMYAAFNSDTTNTQWLAQLTRKRGQFSIGLDFLIRGRTRGDISMTQKQTRLVTRWRTGKFYLRTYVGYNTKTAERDFISIFANLKYKIESYGQIELWSNISEIDHSQGRINRWYAYAKSSLYAAADIAVSLKLSHTYSFGSSDEHRTIVGFDLSCTF